MKSVIKKSMSIVALAATILSFTIAGGEGFEIFVNNKAVIQQFGNNLNEVKNLKLDNQSANAQLTVKYYHCGKPGTNRTIAIRDGQNKLLKEWHFGDAATTSPLMNFNVKEVLSLTKANESELRLYYASGELPNGRLLTTIVVENNSVARNR